MARSNLIPLGDDRFIVRTQAGFRKACKLMKEGGAIQFNGFPTSYPTVATFRYEEYRSYCYTVFCVSIETYRRQLQEQLNLLNSQ